MTVNEQVSILQLKNPAFDRQVIHDVDNRGNEFCELIMQNEKKPNLPITVTVTERGCSISVGQFEDVADSRTMTPEQTLAAIKDITNDKIIFVIAYRDDSKTGFGSPTFSRIFALTGGDDDMSREYDAFINKISSPLTKFSRFFTSLKGRFVIFNFTGSVDREIIR